MINSNSLMVSAVTLLQQDAAFSNAEFKLAYGPSNVPIPLRKMYVTLMLGNIDFNNRFYVSEDATEPCCGITLELVFKLHVSDTQSPAGIHECYLKLSEILSNNLAYTVTQCTCDEIEHSRSTNSYVLTAHVTVFYSECPGENTENAQAAQARTYLCETHVLDTEVHVSSEEKEWLEQPYTVGKYTGTGLLNQQIELGFKPSFVIISPQTYPSYVYDNVANELLCYVAYGNTFGRSRGLSFHSTGFLVTQSESQKINNFVPKLNNADTVYVYTAFK